MYRTQGWVEVYTTYTNYRGLGPLNYHREEGEGKRKRGGGRDKTYRKMRQKTDRKKRTKKEGFAKPGPKRYG